MKVALVQEAPILNVPETNLVLIENYVSEAAKAHTDLVIFPEMFVTGYSISAEFRATYRHELYLESLQYMAGTYKLWLVLGYPERAGDGQLYNTAAIISPKGIIGRYRKVHLFGAEVTMFSPGHSFPVFDTPWGRMGLLICYDIEFPEAARILALRGAQLIIVPTANMIPWQEYQILYTRVRAMENGVFVAVANRVGKEGQVTFCGGSAVAGPDGKWVIEPADVNGLLIGDIDLAICSDIPQEVQYLSQRRPDAYLPLIQRTL